MTTQEQYTVLLEVPGMKETEVNVAVNGDKLIISGDKENKLTQQEQHLYHNELSYGVFSRELTLPKDAVITLIQASLKEGILSIIIPREPLDETKMKHIPINQTH
nr:Hsp20/alpha crystallin family protein [uncultured Shewanella sp.]